MVELIGRIGLPKNDPNPVCFLNWSNIKNLVSHRMITSVKDYVKIAEYEDLIYERNIDAWCSVYNYIIN